MGQNAGYEPYQHSNISRAGFSTVGRGYTNNADSRKHPSVQASPNLVLPIQVILDRSPSIIGGRMEGFGDISNMIEHWEGQEADLENEGKKGGRRRSKVTEELSLKFEEGDTEGHKSRPVSSGGRTSGGGGRDKLLSFQVEPTTVYKRGNISNQINGAGVRTPSACTAKNISKLKLLFSPANDDRPIMEPANQSRARSCVARYGNNPVVRTESNQRKCSLSKAD